MASNRTAIEMGVATELKNRFVRNDSKKIESISICPCGSNRQWLPKKSTEWRCYDCQPPRSEAMINETSWPRQRVETVEIESIDYDTIRTLQAQSYGPFIVCPKSWVCSCGCDWIEESGTMAEVKSNCVVCRKEIEIDLFR